MKIKKIINFAIIALGSIGAIISAWYGLKADIKVEGSVSVDSVAVDSAIIDSVKVVSITPDSL